MKSMNRIFYSLLTLFALVGFMGCSEDDEVKTVATEADLVGTWTMQSSEVDFTVNGQDIIDYMIEVLKISEEEATIQKEILEGGAAMESGMTIELKSNHTYIAKETGEDPDDGTWKLSSDGKKLLIDEGTVDEMEFEFKSIASNNLSLFTERSGKMDFDEDGTDETVEVKMTLNLTK